MFVIACVIFDDLVEAEFAGASIKMLKKKMGWKQEREFKFHRATEEQKKTFFTELRGLNFRIVVTVVDKTKVTEPVLKKDDSFYQRVILLTLERIKNIKRARIYLDGRAGKNYRNRSVAKIRQTLNRKTRRMTEFKMADSENEALVQMADMVAGCMRAKCDPEKTVKRDYL